MNHSLSNQLGRLSLVLQKEKGVIGEKMRDRNVEWRIGCLLKSRESQRKEWLEGRERKVGGRGGQNCQTSEHPLCVSPGLGGRERGLEING